MSGSAPGHATPDVILAHPAFRRARAAYIEAVMAMYEGHPAAIELMLDGGRILIFGTVMCLWGAYREEAPETWPSVTRLKAALALFGLVKSRQIDAILARLEGTGHVQLARAPGDSRLRLVLPTPRMIEHDLDWLRAHYLAHAELFGAGAYARPLGRDRAFQRLSHAIALETFQAAAENVVQNNTPILLFLARSAGLLILMKLIQRLPAEEGAAVALSYSELGARFSVSRTHVRDTLAAAAEQGLLRLEPPGHVTLSPALLRAFDIHLANGMSLQDLAHAAAVARLAAPAG